MEGMKLKMGEYVFVCIGTNKLLFDSFGPRVGNYLKSNLHHNKKVQVLGTMENPIHYTNAKKVLNQLDLNKQKQIILIDSAFSLKAPIGTTYVSLGGIEIGKAFGKSLYVPAHLNIKTVIGNKIEKIRWNKMQLNRLAQNVANQITSVVNE